MEPQITIFVLMEEDTEKVVGEYGRERLIKTVQALEAYTNEDAAGEAVNHWQRGFDIDKEEGNEPDNDRYYYISEIEIIK